MLLSGRSGEGLLGWPDGKVPPDPVRKQRTGGEEHLRSRQALPIPMFLELLAYKH
jgi:hypothetical protein